MVWCGEGDENYMRARRAALCTPLHGSVMGRVLGLWDSASIKYSSMAGFMRQQNGALGLWLHPSMRRCRAGSQPDPERRKSRGGCPLPGSLLGPRQ